VVPLSVRALVAALLFVGSAAAGAQSAYVPLDDVAYVYIDALLARGELRTLSVLERPYTVREIAEALGRSQREWPARPRRDRPPWRETIRVASLGAGEAADCVASPRREDDLWREATLDYCVASATDHPTRQATRRSPHEDLRARLSRAISRYAFRGRARGPFRAEGSFSLWATGETSGRRELMLADNEVSDVFAGGAFRFLMAAGPVVGFSRPVLENRLNSDPEFHGRKDRRIAGRVEDAYLAPQWRFAELFFGRMGRNWGPYPLQGLMLSDAPFTYDHLFGRVGARALRLELLLARLDNDTNATGQQVQRYFATHRLAGRWRGLEAAVMESFVYSGVGRGFEPSLANPLTIYGLAWRNERVEGNLLFGGQIAARTRVGTFSSEVLIDDLQIDRCDTVCQEPSSYGLTFTAEGVPLLFGPRAFASYTRVSSLTYRTPLVSERYSMFDVGLGRGYSDYDEWRVGLDVIPVGVPLRLYYAQRRQGAGDFRLLFPDPAQYATHPGIFEGVVMRVRRIGLSGGAVIGDFDARGDIGYNSVRNADHIIGKSESRFEGRVRVSWNPSWAVVRLAP
jgi:hypothetical protein